MTIETIAVWFSCGAASAVAAKMTLDQYGSTHHVRIVNSPVIEEDDDNRRFLNDVQDWLGVEVEYAINPKYDKCSAVDVWNRRKFMSGNAGAPCTVHLKKDARYLWEKENHVDWHVLGFTADEKDRHKRFVLGERDNVIPVLIDGGVTKAMCYQIIAEAGIALPRIYSMGYPNANCIGCVKATSPTYWNHVKKMHPDVFQQRADQSRELGVKLVRVKGKRIFLDELTGNEIGRPMKNMDFECGIFCKGIE
jgi:hypothetical protein